MEDNIIIIDLCGSEYSTFVGLWDQYGRRILSDSDSCAGTKQSRLVSVPLSIGIYIIDITGYDGAIGTYHLEFKCIKKYLECDDTIFAETTPSDDPHYYAFKNKYDGNMITIDTCGSQYYIESYMHMLDNELSEATFSNSPSCSDLVIAMELRVSLLNYP